MGISYTCRKARNRRRHAVVGFCARARAPPSRRPRRARGARRAASRRRDGIARRTPARVDARDAADAADASDRVARTDGNNLIVVGRRAAARRERARGIGRDARAPYPRADTPGS